MATFLPILGYGLAIIWLLITIFIYACGKDEQKERDGSWKLFFFASIFLLVTAVYCGISAHILFALNN